MRPPAIGLAHRTGGWCVGRPAARWTAWLLLVLAAGAQALPVTDDRGVTVDLREAPRRIVTLLPSLTETVCALGACERLVGVDDWSNWPEPVRTLPHVGGLDDAQVERLVALRPDVVLVGATARAAARLERLGIPVVGLDIKTLADARRVFDTVGRLLQVPGAEKAWQLVEAGVEAAVRSVPAAARGTSVYFEVSAGPYAASESSHIGELLTRLGATNVVPARLGSVPKLNPEFVVRADPQLILIADRDAPSLATRPGWSRIRALRDGRVCALSAAQGDVVVRPGPRLAEAAQVLADCLAGRLKGPR
ncbi:MULTISPECIES: ABC transporter substrate-binding protein [Ramlibacter]|uniref:ABC transporter substrate-binding protein n=1 Tax=Ramlibacter pinisoli TaxID=2682844 RepID=A0A6N8IXV2_9BURK|nr:MULTISPECIES: helical backbone metal receptor [Ramlibacter]MBA2961471.1 ABC transporter substrate-binding protein [Ramlibacter sp. CGMCC 1.13660]MVQ31415.1 ABC transporter substrate-binding protein [Ramlibacter pinisoli]